jgi:hypothetical protein
MLEEVEGTNTAVVWTKVRAWLACTSPDAANNNVGLHMANSSWRFCFVSLTTLVFY